MRILTIADQSGFTKAGGIIILTSAKNRINLEINNNAAVQAHVRISSQRLKLSKLGTD